jgi:hypothetical protein
MAPVLTRGPKFQNSPDHTFAERVEPVPGIELKILIDPSGTKWATVADVRRYAGETAVDVMLSHLDPDELSTAIIDNLQVAIVSRPGILRICEASTNGNAMRLARFMRHEVMESVFNTGGYQAPGARRGGSIMETARAFMEFAEALEREQAEREALTRRHETLQAKVDGIEAFATGTRGWHNLVPWARTFGVPIPPGCKSGQESYEGGVCGRIGRAMGYEPQKHDHYRYPLSADGKKGGINLWPDEVLFAWLEDYVTRFPHYRDVVERYKDIAAQNGRLPSQRRAHP